MMNNIILITLISAIALIFCCAQHPGPEKNSAFPTEPVAPFEKKREKLNFAQYYSKSPLDINLQVSQYSLPLKTSQISNFSDFSAKISLSNDALKLLEKNGFVVITNPFNAREEDVTQPYKILRKREIPIFITSDSLLHYYHIQFDETLRQIEEKEFYHKIWEISRELLDDSLDKYNNTNGELKESARRNAAYFAVGLSLIQPKPDQLYNEGLRWQDPAIAHAYFKKEDLQKYRFRVPHFVEEEVEKELSLIEEHSGFAVSPIFRYYEDYSQYVPRGHYTRSEILKNYFKGLMWYGRMSFLIKKDLIKSTSPERDANLQTMGACLIASKFAESPEIKNKWDRIYSVTAFYVGLSDDLGPYEYIEALDRVFSGSFDLQYLTKENIDKLKVELAKFQPPKIYGGTGRCVIIPPFTPEKAEECLKATQGMRLMGQRFIPDSYVFSNLVGFDYMGNQEPFTMVIDPLGRKIRGFPRGLDAMAMLGSKRARELLSELDDSNYKFYSKAFNKLREEFDAFDINEWNKNLYWSWLYSLKALLGVFGKGYPTFMQTKAWQDKELTTALASWSQLRHDTILYAKQSYTMLGAIPEPPPPVVGYVEPVPEFYNRLLALIRMTNRGLSEMKALDEVSLSRLQNLEKVLERLVSISQKELENKELTQDDYDFIKNFGDSLNAVISEVDDRAKKTTIIADVHTDTNSNRVLEEGTGYVKLMVVAYKVPDGRILMGAGPVLSYYEFKQPMDNRLTDEKWRELLASKPPEEPEWTSNFAQ